MRIAVLVKQIPVPAQMRMEDGRVVRSGVDLEVNAYCRRANAKALELAGAHGEVVVFTMGPPSADDALREMIAAGATRGIHICDQAFAGSDTLATAVVLAAALRQVGPFDLVLAGLNSLDADTGQVPAEVAELLGMPFAAGVRNLDISTPSTDHARTSSTRPVVESGKVGNTGTGIDHARTSSTRPDSGNPETGNAHRHAFTARLETDEGYRTVTGYLPAVLSTAERLCYPSKRPPEERQAVSADRISRLTAADLGLSADEVGAAGSPTSVGPVRAVVAPDRSPVKAESVPAAVDMLVELGAFEARSDQDEVPRPDDSKYVPLLDGPAIWCFFTAADIGSELLGEAAELARDISGSVTAVTTEDGLAAFAEMESDSFVQQESDSCAQPESNSSDAVAGSASNNSDDSSSADSAAHTLAGSSTTDSATDHGSSSADSAARISAGGSATDRSKALARLSAAGADRVMLIRTDGQGEGPVGICEPAEAADALATAAGTELPWALLVEGTRTGRVVASIVAARHGWGLTGDAVAVQVGADRRLVAWKPAFGGQVEAPIRSRSAVQMATIRPGVLSRRPSRRGAPVIELETLPAGAPARLRTVSVDPDDDDVGMLRRASAVVALGQGVEPDGYPVINDFCAALGGAALGATRKVTDKGWIPRNRQIGVTGHAVGPRLLVAVGSSGRFNHTVGIRNAGVILAVNNNPDAEIFDQVDVGLVGDWHQVVPELTNELTTRGLAVEPRTN